MSHPKWNLSIEETNILLSELAIVEKRDSEKIKRMDIRIKSKRVIPIKKSKTKTLKELKEQAKDLGIKGYYSLKKSEIEEAINKLGIKKEKEITQSPGEFIKPVNKENNNQVKDSNLIITAMTTVKDLKEKCRQLKIKGFSKMNKSELEKAITDKNIKKPTESKIVDNDNTSDTEYDYIEPPINNDEEVGIYYNESDEESTRGGENISTIDESEIDFFNKISRKKANEEKYIGDELELETDYV